MVKHNNVIPNVHLRKHWQRNVRVWLNQAGRKHRRLEARRARAAAIAPRPLDTLRPSVRCQTIRYNHRPRLGKGFTLAEIKSVGLGLQFARSVGIAIDHRRKNRSQEGFEANKARLTNYLSKLVLYPRHESHLVTKAKTGIVNDTPKVHSQFTQDQQTVATAPVVNVLPSLVKRVRSVSALQLESLRKSSAYRSIRQEWNNQRNEGKRQKKAREAAEKNN